MTRTRVGWLLVVLQFALLIALVLLPRRPASLLSLVVGVPLIVAGLVLALVSARALRGALTPTPVPIPGAGLRTDGVYRNVRHPIYSGVLLAVIGYVVAIGSLWSLAWAVLILVFFVVKSRWEDSLLRAEYGAEWESWAEFAGALLPRVSRR